MPQYELKAPNGKTYTIEGPAGATEEQVRAEILRRDPNAGRAAAPKPPTRPNDARQALRAGEARLATQTARATPAVRADALRRYNADPRVVSLRKATEAEDTRPTSFWQGVGEGIMKPWDNAARALETGMEKVGVAKPINALGAMMGLAPSVNAGADIRQAASDRSATRGSTAGNITGNIAGTLPTLMLPGGVIAQGAASGALLTDKRELGGIATDAAIGGVAGKVGDVVGRRVIAPAARPLIERGAKIFGRVTPRAVTQAAPNGVPAVQQAMTGAVPSAAPAVTPVAQAMSPVRQTVTELGELGREAGVRAARMRAAGVQSPTLGMVTRDPRLWNVEREGMKRFGAAGDEIMGAIKGAEADIVTSARGIVDRQGGAIGAEASGLRVSKALADKSDQLNKTVGALYTRARNQFGSAKVPTLENLKNAQAHPDWADNAAFDDMSAAINRRLGRYADADGGQPGLTVNQSEELRKFIGNIGPNDRQGFAMRRVFQDALDTDVLDNFGGAPFATARAAAKARFDEFKGSFAGKLAEEGIAPERIASRLTSQATPLKDLRALRRSLTTGTAQQRAAGENAMRSLGTQALDDIFSKGITPDGKVNGTTMFRTFMDAAPRLRILLPPDAYKQARRLAVVAREATADVPYSGVNYSNTTSAAANLFPDIVENGGRLLPNAVRRIAGATLGSTGGLAGALAGDAAAQGANEAIARRGAKSVAEQAMRQAELAKSPELAAAAMRKIAESEAVDATVREFAGKIADALGNYSGKALAPVAAVGAVTSLQNQ